LPTLSMKVSDDLDRDLAALARRRGVSKSALIREAMAELVASAARAEAGSAGGAGAAEGATANDDADEYGW